MAKRIIVVAGPSCCGKTTLLRQLLRGELTELAECCSLGDPSDWQLGDIWLNEDALSQAVRQATDEQFILHYTIPYPSLKYVLRGYDKKKRLETLFAAEDVFVLTLWADSDTLIERVDQRRARQRERLAEGRMSHASYLKALWLLRKRRRMYSDVDFIQSMYDRWLTYLEGTHAKHVAVDVNRRPTLMEPGATRIGKVAHSSY